MDTSAILDRLNERCSDRIAGSNLEAIDPWIEVSAEGLLEVVRFLRDDAQLRMNMLHCVSGIDYFEPNEKKAAKVDWDPHIEVVYHLSSMVHRHRLVVKVMLPRWKDDVVGRLPEVPSMTGLFNTAEWHEREVHDLCGIRFLDHPDPRRILCPEDWVGHPLRKDYEAPDEYHGIKAK